MTNSHTSPIADTEPEVPNTDTSPSSSHTPPSPESRKRRPDTTDDEPIPSRTRSDPRNWDWYPSLIGLWIRNQQVPVLPTPDTTPTSLTLPPLRHPLDRAFAAFVATMDDEVSRLRDVTDEVPGMQERGDALEHRVERLAQDLEETDGYHNNLVDSVQALRTRVDELEVRLEDAHARAAAAEEMAGVAEALVAQAMEPEDEDPEEEPDVVVLDSDDEGSVVTTDGSVD